MKKIFSLAVLAISLLTVSCKKDKNDIGNPSPVQKQLKQTTLDENWSFSYYADGSLKEMSLSGNYQQKFIYSASSVEVLSFTSGKVSSKAIFTLNNGKPVQLNMTNYNSMGQPINSYAESYEYNGKGLLQKKIYPSANFETYEYDGNDNMIRINHHNNMGVATAKTEYAYGNQKDLYPQYSYVNCTVVAPLFPPFAKYLPVSKTTTDLPSNDMTSHYVISYELDGDGYVVKGHAISQIAPYTDTHWTNTF